MRTPSSYRLEYVDSTLDTPIVQFVHTLDEVKRIAATGVIFKRIAQYDEADEAVCGIDPHRLVNAKEKVHLLRFVECCEDSGAGGHDVPKDAIKRLVALGLLRHVGFGRHQITVIGETFLDHFRPSAC